MNRKFNITGSQRGASLLESIAFLGIAAIVILGAVALLMGGFSGANSNKAETEISAIRTGVKRLYMGQTSSYGTESLNATLVSARVFPSTLAATAAGVVRNSWDGDVIVSGATSAFTISYDRVPEDVCIALLRTNADWVSVSVNGTALTPPVTPTTAAGACTETNRIIWTAT